MSLKPADLLTWHADLGYGFFPVNPGEWPYDASYVEKYEAMADTPMATELNAHRVFLALLAKTPFNVNAHVTNFIDIGPGDGAFMRRLSKCLPEGEDLVFGFDVNPVMVERLKADNRFATPQTEGAGSYGQRWDVMTFWDSFEHIHRPDLTIQHANTVAMSIPIFNNREHVLASKHFRPDEHVWYFTNAGIITFMARCGFECTMKSDKETRIGREGIMSYVFRRVK